MVTLITREKTCGILWGLQCFASVRGYKGGKIVRPRPPSKVCMGGLEFMINHVATANNLGLSIFGPPC